MFRIFPHPESVRILPRGLARVRDPVRLEGPVGGPHVVHRPGGGGQQRGGAATAQPLLDLRRVAAEAAQSGRSADRDAAEASSASQVRFTSLLCLSMLLSVRWGLMDYRTTKFENDANRPSCKKVTQKYYVF